MILGAFIYLAMLLFVAGFIIWCFLKAFKRPQKIEVSKQQISKRDPKAKALSELVPPIVEPNFPPKSLSFVLRKFNPLLSKQQLDILESPTHSRVMLTTQQILGTPKLEEKVSEKDKHSKRTYRKKNQSYFEKTAEE